MSFRNIAVRSIAVGSAFLIAGCADAPSDPSARGDLAPSYDRSETAQARLAAIFPETSADVMSLPGTVFADHDETVGKLVFGVENANAIPGIQRALAARGVSAGEYAIEVTAPIRQLQTPLTLRSSFRPTQAGTQINFGGYVCTMGFNVDHAGGRSFITNSHCTNTQGGTEGTTYGQPLLSGGTIATEAQDPTYFKNGVCPRGKKCRYSDASRARYADAVGSNRGEIRNTDGVNTTSLTTTGIFTITSQDASTTHFTKGTTLNKVGRTTGWSQGPVDRTCINTNVQGSQVHQLCQTTVTANVAGGDSGSPVFRILSGSNVELVGILWGGGTGYFVMSPLSGIVKTTEIGPVTATK